MSQNPCGRRREIPMGGLCQLRMCALCTSSSRTNSDKTPLALLCCSAVLQVAFLPFPFSPSLTDLLTLLTYARNKRHASHINEKHHPPFCCFLLVTENERHREKQILPTTKSQRHHHILCSLPSQMIHSEDLISRSC
jgi:hypothetical protein